MKKGALFLIVLAVLVASAAWSRGINPYEQFSTGLMEPMVDYGDRTDGQPVYVGYRLQGGNEDDDAACIIYKITYDGDGHFLRMVLANGDNSPNKVWDDRATYTYSAD